MRGHVHSVGPPLLGGVRTLAPTCDDAVVGLGPGAPAWTPPVAPRAYVSTVRIGDPRADVRTGVDAVRLPLPGGWVATAWAGELHDAVDRLAAVTRRSELVEVAR